MTTLQSPMTIAFAFKWSVERVTELKESWASGLSASVIGDNLGCTRNAVIGKVHRLGLEARRTVATRTPRGEGQQRPRRIMRPRIEGPSEEEMEREKELLQAHVESLEQAVDFEALRQHHCRFVVRTSDQGGTLYCGRPKQMRSYCLGHAHRCFTEHVFTR